MILITVISCKTSEVLPSDDLKFTDPPLTDEQLKALEDASVSVNDYLDSATVLDGRTYREVLNSPSWQAKFDSVKNSLRVSSYSVTDRVRTDIDNILLYGDFLSLINEKKIFERNGLSEIEPTQMAYAYVQRSQPKRQIEFREFPDIGNDLHRKYKVVGIDCSGLLYLLLKNSGFQDCNFSISAGTFKSLISNSVSQKYNGSAELIEVGSISKASMKKGDFIVWASHIGIVSKELRDPLIVQSNGTALPKNEEDQKKNYFFSGIPVKRGISIKSLSTLESWKMGPYKVFRIVPKISQLEIVSGNNQVGEEGKYLSNPIRIKVSDANGFGMSNVSVVFTVISGGGSTADESTITSSDGNATTTWKLGNKSIGAQKLKVTVKDFLDREIADKELIFDSKILQFNACGDEISDIDGNIYSTVSIGNQCWMKSDLKVLKRNNSQPLNEGLDYIKTDSSVHYSGNLIYYTGTDVCPTGWHLPSDEEWNNLANALGGLEVAGGKLKSISGWPNPEFSSNESGFSALPTFGTKGAYYWGNRTVYSGRPSNAYRQLIPTSTMLIFGYASSTSYPISINSKISIRCLKDN